MGHGLGAELLLQGGALASTLERREPPRFGICLGLFLTQLPLGRRYLLRLGPKHPPLERLHGGLDRGELAHDVGELGPQGLRLLTPGTVMIVGQLRHDNLGITIGGSSCAWVAGLITGAAADAVPAIVRITPPPSRVEIAGSESFDARRPTHRVTSLYNPAPVFTPERAGCHTPHQPLSLSTPRAAGAS